MIPSTHNGSEQSVALVLEDPTLLTSKGTLCKCYIDIHTGETPTHMKLKKQNKIKNLKRTKQGNVSSGYNASYR